MDITSENQPQHILSHVSSEMNIDAVIDESLTKAAIPTDSEQQSNSPFNLYQSIFAKSVVPTIVFKSDGTILLINKALEQLYGAPMSSHINRCTIEELFARRQRKKIITQYRQMSPEQMKSVQVLFQCHNGEERIIELELCSLGDNNLLTATLLDLTEYKIYESRVQELVDRISMINEVVAAMNSNLNKDRLVQIFFNQMNKIFNYDLACLTLCDIEEQELDIHISRDEFESESRKIVRSIYRSFIETVLSFNQIEQDADKIATIMNFLGLSVNEQHRSRILIQLKTDEQLIGVVLLLSRTEHLLTPDHIEIFQEIADPIAIAFMKARLLQRYQQSLTNLSFLARINESLSSSLNLDVVLKQVVESAQQMIHARICTIHFLAEKHYISNVTHYAKQSLIDQFKLPIQQVIHNQKPFMAENIDYDSPEFFRNRTEFQKLGLKSLIILPIISRQKTIALLSVFLDKIHYFSEHEIELLSMLCNQAAIALENATLYNKAEQTKNYLESIIQSSADMIISTDLEGNITFFSNSASQLTGYSSKEVLNNPFFERLFKNGRAVFSGLKQQLLSTDRVQSFECEMITRQNQLIPISWSFSSLVSQQHKTIGTLGIGKDISKPRMIEAEIQKQSEELEKLINLICHNLKIPLISIKEFVSLFKTHYDDKIEGKGQYFLDHIQKNVEYMENLIQDLLNNSGVNQNLYTINEF